MEIKTIYTLHYWDPKQGFEGREWEGQRMFLSKEVAEEVRNGVMMFEPEGSELVVTVHTKELYSEETFSEWMANHGPGAKREVG